jgi:hypothetical protein
VSFNQKYDTHKVITSPIIFWSKSDYFYIALISLKIIKGDSPLNYPPLIHSRFLPYLYSARNELMVAGNIQESFRLTDIISSLHVFPPSLSVDALRRDTRGATRPSTTIQLIIDSPTTRSARSLQLNTDIASTRFFWEEEYDRLEKDRSSKLGLMVKSHKNQINSIRTPPIKVQHTDLPIEMRKKAKILYEQGKLDEALVIEQRANHLEAKLKSRAEIEMANKVQNIKRSLVEYQKNEVHQFELDWIVDRRRLRTKMQDEIDSRIRKSTYN